MANANDFAVMGKVELRAACKEHGVKNYGKMNNDAMRAALVEATTSEKQTEPAPLAATTWGGLVAGAAVPAPVKAANITKVIDGKKVDPSKPKQKTERAPRVEKPAAPTVPRVSSKGYTIQKEREERNGVKRPSVGTVCEAVWSAFDVMHTSETGLKASDLQKLADDHGWNRTNVSCEFYAWRKFMGIKGRAAK